MKQNEEFIRFVQFFNYTFRKVYAYEPMCTSGQNDTKIKSSNTHQIFLHSSRAPQHPRDFLMSPSDRLEAHMKLERTHGQRAHRLISLGRTDVSDRGRGSASALKPLNPHHKASSHTNWSAARSRQQHQKTTRLCLKINPNVQESQEGCTGAQKPPMTEGSTRGELNKYD